MSAKEPDLSGEPKSLIESLSRQKGELGELSQGHHGHGGPIETVRESTYRGHHIVVRTTYSITVDDLAVEGHLGVSNDGQVHYHAIPNLGFSSAIELVEKLIDTFPDDFEDSDGEGPHHGHGDPGPHDHPEGHGDPGPHDHPEGHGDPEPHDHPTGDYGHEPTDHEAS
jgi:hypothetical protein